MTVDFVWEKPVIIFYRERVKEREKKAFAVVKAAKLEVKSTGSAEYAEFQGNIQDFFPLMGDIDHVSSDEGLADRYVLCWFEDREDDFDKAWRRLIGVTFSEAPVLTTDEKGKRSYSAVFKAKHGKLT